MALLVALILNTLKPAREAGFYKYVFDGWGGVEEHSITIADDSDVNESPNSCKLNTFYI